VKDVLKAEKVIKVGKVINSQRKHPVSEGIIIKNKPFKKVFKITLFF